MSSQSCVQPGGVATVGICKGGEMALAMAIHYPEKVGSVTLLFVILLWIDSPDSVISVSHPQ